MDFLRVPLIENYLSFDGVVRSTLEKLLPYEPPVVVNPLAQRVLLGMNCLLGCYRANADKPIMFWIVPMLRLATVSRGFKSITVCFQNWWNIMTILQLRLESWRRCSSHKTVWDTYDVAVANMNFTPEFADMFFFSLEVDLCDDECIEVEDGGHPETVDVLPCEMPLFEADTSSLGVGREKRVVSVPEPCWFEETFSLDRDVQVSSLNLQFDNTVVKQVVKYVPDNSPVLGSPFQGFNSGCVSDAIEEVLPHHTLSDDRFDQVWVEACDIYLDFQGSLDLSKFNDVDPNLNCWEPVYNTGLPSTRYTSQREAVLAIKKRNLNVPTLTDCCDVDALSTEVVDKFFSTFIDLEKFASFPNDLLGVGWFLDDYLKRKQVPEDLYLQELSMLSVDKYRHMIKSQLKPPLEDVLHLERALPATITYHTKDKVAASTPFFLAISAKLLNVLNSKVVIPSGKDHQLFSIDPYIFKEVKFWKEIDYSKFDKSQGRLHHEIQRKLFRRLHSNPDYDNFIETWFSAHMRSKIYDRDAGVGFSTDYQRRTGDACTYLGNTLVTLCTLSYIYDLTSPNVGLVVASGDDSLIGTIKHLLPRDKEQFCSTLFNFETKFPHNQPFICSKFLVLDQLENGGERVNAYPDPYKLLIRVGVKFMTNTKFESWAESFFDSFSCYSTIESVSKVVEMAGYRYIRNSPKFLLPALHHLKYLCRSRDALRAGLFGKEYSSAHCRNSRTRSDTTTKTVKKRGKR
ncbi:putative polymerase p2 [Ilarvirus APLPV]|uniref:RNA-directed RNA polymerase 2a n=1 Tax=Ilarvirus APLPV TaxID=134632 RepID=Q997A3_9BROM|nr:putative polymerase p2 [American plum line pattern virus]AAK15028.1 putative polymerase p2 [American plum line pattern virus]